MYFSFYNPPQSNKFNLQSNKIVAELHEFDQIVVWLYGLQNYVLFMDCQKYTTILNNWDRLIEMLLQAIVRVIRVFPTFRGVCFEDCVQIILFSIERALILSKQSSNKAMPFLHSPHFLLLHPPPPLPSHSFHQNCASGATSSLAQCLYHLVKGLSSLRWYQFLSSILSPMPS